jgi:HSF-type DNA-binding
VPSNNMIVMQPSRSNLPSSREHWRSSSLLSPESADGLSAYPPQSRGTTEAYEPPEYERRASLSASFLPPDASSHPHARRAQYVGGSSLDLGLHQQQMQQQQQQRDQLFDLYEQQRVLDAQRLQLLHERQQAYLEAASSYDESNLSSQGHLYGGGPHNITLRESLLPSFLQQQPQQPRLSSSDDYLLSRQNTRVYPPQVQAQSQFQHSYMGHRTFDDHGPSSEQRAWSLLQRLPTSQWNQPSSILSSSLRTWEDDNVGKMGPPQDYERFTSSSRAFAGFGLVNNAPASEDETDSGKIEAARGPTSFILPVPSQIDYGAHKAGPDLESALAASLTGGIGGVGSSIGGGGTTDKSNAASFPSERANLEALTTRCETPAQATRVLRNLGSTLRSKADPFVDVTTLPFVPTASDSMTPSSGLGVASKKPTAPTASASNSTSFPETLHELLEMADREQLDDIVSWLPHKRAFRINNKERFMQEILPMYFKGQNRWSSFLRQLNLYGFSRVAKGTDYGAYYHELMIGGRPDLCQFMRRVGTPKGLDRRTFKLAEGDDPDFYAMPLVMGSLNHHLALHPHPQGLISSLQRRSG